MDTLISAALAEDLDKNGDITSSFFIAESARSSATLLAKQDGVVSGMKVVAAVLAKVDPKLKLKSC